MPMPYARKAESLRYRKSAHRRREKPLRKPHTGARRSGLRGKHRKLVEFYKGEETRLSQRHAGPEAHGQNVHTGTGRQPKMFRSPHLYGDAVVAAAAAAVVSGAAVVASPTPDSMLDISDISSKRISF